jgi:hypothetical protein
MSSGGIMAMPVKIDLEKVQNLWHFSIHGATADGDVDLEFKDLMTAAAFVRSNEIAGKTKFTFPDTVRGFNHTVTITVADYAETFREIETYRR